MFQNIKWPFFTHTEKFKDKIKKPIQEVTQQESSKEKINKIRKEVDEETTSEFIEIRLKKLEETVENFKNKNESLEKRIKILSSVNKEFVNSFNEILEILEEEKTNAKEKSTERFAIINKNFKFVTEKNKKLEDKFDGLLELMSEKMSEEDILPDIFSQGSSVRKILSSTKNKQKAALFSLVFLAKRYFEGKGLKV